MKLSAAWLHDPATQRICALLTDAGYQALFVGGCVRDVLLQMPVTDIDLASDAEPETIMALAHAANIRAVPTGLAHGTITLVANGSACQVTSFRKDISTDGRRAVVAFSTDLLDDANRRDFTLNALYARPDGTLVDPLDGLADLRARKIRFIGDPDQRIAEDYLRILRFFRFQAWFGDPDQPIDASGLAACQRNLGGLNTLSRERIGMELRKLLSAPDPAAATLAMHQSGALLRALPGASAQHLPALNALELAGKFPPRWQRRLAAIGGTDTETSLRLSRFEGRELATVQAAIASNISVRQCAQRFGATAAIDAALITCAKTGAALPADLRELAQSGAGESFPLRAADLAGYVSNGPAMGRALARLREAWIVSDMTLSRAQLLSDLVQPS